MRDERGIARGKQSREGEYTEQSRETGHDKHRRQGS